ncbi:MAG TPA: DUF1549 domain-containing protein, partial [Planctomycetaceae bacterium]|nr:DUF1549 domain-containing protein [Planctomycetaceae bacterium]
MLETVAGIAAGGSRGKLWKGDDPEQSLLVKAVRYGDPDLQMPPEGKLKPAEIELLERWIRAGAPLPEYKAEVRPEAQKIDYEHARKFWSFRPLGKIELPEVSNGDRVRTPLDRFVYKQLEDRELKPNPEADRITLIRRLSFDLIGLPPTAEEVEAFLADESPDAYERLVERLLESPHYGERWARFWLDLARYTDTTASWLDSTASAWLYRDWVISAFNRNRSYDEFVRLQLAGDLIPGTPPEDLAALGFLGLSPTYWKELKLAPEVIEQVVAEEWDERIDAVSRTFLGLTIACARCHDHKFDPITTRDYYALAGVFASTQFDDRPMLPADEAEAVKNARDQIAALEAKLKAIKDNKSEEAEKLNAEIESIRTSTPHYDTPWMNIVREASLYVKPDGEDATRLEYKEREPRDLPVFRRGNPSNPGPVVPRGFPVLFSTTEQPVVFENGSGRRELAETMLTDTQALLARVFV